VFALTVLLCGCEYFLSDVATRIRYALLDESDRLLASSSETSTIRLRPDHWPDACPRGLGYRLSLSPYKGGKQVKTGDIVVTCVGGGAYYTGMGSERLYVSREISIDKKTEDELRITVRKTLAGAEIVGLQ
jgi:hypothetical protein